MLKSNRDPTQRYKVIIENLLTRVMKFVVVFENILGIVNTFAAGQCDLRMLWVSVLNKALIFNDFHNVNFKKHRTVCFIKLIVIYLIHEA